VSETLSGQIEKVTFLNDESGFSIVSLRVPGRAEPLTALGQLNFPAAGELVELTGDFKSHPRFGVQFEASSCSARPPDSEQGLCKYLGSGLIKGVGPVTARRLVEAFGLDVLEVIDKHPERLAGIRGMSAARLERIADSWRSATGLKRLLSFLSAFGLGPALGAKILKRFGARAEEIIREDPYRLAYDFYGVGFLTADRVAGHLGFPPDCPQRLEAGLLYCLDEAARFGHDFLPSGELMAAAGKLVPEATAGALDEALLKVALSGRAVCERQETPGETDVYPPQTHRAESWVARCLASTLTTEFSVEVPRRERALEWAQKTMALELSDDQKDAAMMAVSRKVSVITGGPGTGKTTMTRAVCHIWRAVTPRIALVAPTGRAAKRLSQATGFEATTIHRLLEYSPAAGGFLHGPDNRLDLDMILVDEASMIDVLLMNQLLGSVPPTTAVVLVGDQDQLPPVGPGRVLADILASGQIPARELTKIYRQAEQSSIVRAAHMINSGRSPSVIPNDPDSDFFFVPEEDPVKIIDKIVRLVCERIPRKLNVDAASDIMVLSPTKKGELGTVNLNNILGRALNPARGGLGSVTRFGQTFQTGDRVMQVRNNYQKDVYNGDLGRIVGVNSEDQELGVLFDDREVLYDFADLDQLAVAWASTVHKAQGSEFPAVVIPLHSSHHIMLRRKLIYTAVTRGRRMVFIVGSPDALRRAVTNNHEDTRHSNLDKRVREAVKAARKLKPNSVY
jgi:exodeoxyribonuclease V alpha subunit